MLLLAAAPARSPILAFNLMQPGAWQLRAVGGGEGARRQCVADPRDLIQLRHPGAICSRFVLANEAETATIHYTCTGTGYGRTTIKVETGELIRVESQGISNKSPFEDAFEGRHVAKCDPEQAAR